MFRFATSVEFRVYRYRVLRFEEFSLILLTSIA